MTAHRLGDEARRRLLGYFDEPVPLEDVIVLGAPGALSIEVDHRGDVESDQGRDTDTKA